MNFEMTKEEAADLARLIERLRKRVPGDNWQKPGIENALGQARTRATAPELACAAIRAAINPFNKTPAIIGMDGPHWREATTPPKPLRVARDERCSVCSEHHEKCRRLWADDHEFDSMADAAKRKAARTPDDIGATIAGLKDMLAPTIKAEPRKGLEDMANRNPKLKARVDAIRAEIIPDAPTREPEAVSEA